MIPNLASELSIGSDFHLNPNDGTSTDASIFTIARKPLNLNILLEPSVSADSLVAFHWTRRLSRAGVTGAFGSGHFG